MEPLAQFLDVGFAEFARTTQNHRNHALRTKKRRQVFLPEIVRRHEFLDDLNG